MVMVEHRGRRSGRLYHTPVDAFRVGDGWLIVLTYGARTDWVANVLAAGGCRIKTRQGWRQLSAPRLVRGAEWRRRLPAVVRLVLRLIGADEFLLLTDDGAARERS
jgi:deazaflavin-dependent oxidoreductase (nitroreductase family)